MRHDAAQVLMFLMQDGVDLGDVVLPPWAGGSPEEFVRLHREALEGEVRACHGFEEASRSSAGQTMCGRT